MRRNKIRHRANLAPLAAACLLAASGPAWATFNFITDTWLPPGAGVQPDWLNPTLWSTGTVPNDDAVNKYLVNIPGSDTVNLVNDPPYTASSSTVYDLNLGGGSTLNVYVPLTVEDAINGNGANVNVIGTTLTLATPPVGAVIPANIYVQSGGTASLAYTEIDLTNGGQTLSANGAGSVLDLHTVQTILFNGGNADYISATNGGLVNLSGATSIVNNGGGALYLQVGGGGTINLNGLQTIGAGGGGQPTIFQLTNAATGSFSLPSLTTADYTEFNVPAGMTINAPQLTNVYNSTISLASGGTFTTGSLSDIDNASISVSGGATFGSVTASSITLSNNYNNNITGTPTFSADGAGSVLDLHTVQTLNVGTYYTSYVSATNGGLVNLSGLTSINAGGSSGLTLQVGNGGAINLNGLQAIGVGGGSLPTIFQLTNSATGSFSLPSLTTANFTEFKIPSGMTINAPQLTNVYNSTISLASGGTFTTGSLSDIDNASISVSGGATFGSVTASSITLSNNYNNNITGTPTFSADGAGSVLDLHTVKALNVGTYYSGYVSATNGGLVNLSGLTSIDVFGGELTLQVGNSGAINLSGLQTINANGGGQRALFQLANAPTGSFSLPSLTTANYTQFNVPSGMTINAPKLTNIYNSVVSVGGGTFTTGSLADIDNASIFASGGAVIGSVAASSVTWNNNYNNSITGTPTFSADGTGSVLDLHTVKTLNVGTYYTSYVSATNGGLVNLSGLTSINVGGNGALSLQAGGGGTLNLNNLQFVNIGAGGTPANFNSGTNGTINIGGSFQAQNAQFNVTDSTGKLNFLSNVNLGSTTSLNLAAGATLQVKGNFSHSITNTSSFQASGAILQMNGHGLQTLELAGADDGAVNPGNNGNFGFGQLEFGQPTVPTEVDLVDAVNNGNRGVGNANEALYLYGVGGQGGLVLNGGSILLIGNYNAYSYQDGGWTNLQNLFTGSQTIVPYTLNGSDGYVARNLTALQTVWQNPGNGAWNTGTNWNTNTVPGVFNDVFITPVAGVTVTGPTSSTTFRSVTIDATPAGTLSVLNLSSAATITIQNNIQIGAQGQINQQAGTLTAQQMTVAGAFSQSGGTVFNLSGGLTSNAAVTSAGSFTVGGAFVNNGTYIQSAGSANIGSMSGIGSTNVGPGVTLNVGNLTQLGGLVSNGIVNISGGGTVKSITGNGALTIKSGTLQIAVNAGVNTVSSLSIVPGASLDLGNSRLMIDYGSAHDPIASIVGWIISGYAGGAWDGPGIMSSTAEANSGHYGIGFADSADPGNPAGLPADTIEVRYTLLADADLSGAVNIADFNILASHFGTTGDSWDRGDFDYNGSVNISDFNLLAENFGQTASQSSGSAALQLFAQENGLIASVPEPASTAMILLAGGFLFRRRRYSPAKM